MSLSLSPSLQAFLLQTVDGKHQDLKYISPETVCWDELFFGAFGTSVCMLTSPGVRLQALGQPLPASLSHWDPPLWPPAGGGSADRQVQPHRGEVCDCRLQIPL